MTEPAFPDDTGTVSNPNDDVAAIRAKHEELTPPGAGVDQVKSGKNILTSDQEDGDKSGAKAKLHPIPDPGPGPDPGFRLDVGAGTDAGAGTATDTGADADADAGPDADAGAGTGAGTGASAGPDADVDVDADVDAGAGTDADATIDLSALVSSVAAEIVLPDEEGVRFSSLVSEPQLKQAPEQNLGRVAQLARWWLAVTDSAELRIPTHFASVIVVGDHANYRDETSDGGYAQDWLQRAQHRVGSVATLAAITNTQLRVAPVASRDIPEAIRYGLKLTDELVDSGTELITMGDVGTGATTAAAILTSLMCHKNAAEVTGYGAGIDDHTWMRKCAYIRDHAYAARSFRGDPIALLTALNDPVLACSYAVLLRAAARRTPIMLDGVISTAAALLVNAQAFRAARWWMASYRGTEPAHGLALDRLRLHPVLGFDMSVEAGLGGLLALPTLVNSLRLAHALSTS